MLSIIIVNYNSTNHTIECLESLERQNFDDFEILLIENFSDDYYRKFLYDYLDSGKLKEEFLQKINLIETNENLGFTGGNNLGIRNAQGEVILLLNNDTLHQPNFLKEMVDFFNKYSIIDIAQPRICFYPNINIIWCDGGSINKFSHKLFSHFNYLEKIENIDKKNLKIDYAVGCALFIRRRILRDIGLLDDIYFMYCEESDLCYRAKLKGYRNIYSHPSAVIYHKIPKKFSKAYKKYYYKNRIIFVIKHFNFLLIFWQIIMQIVSMLFITADMDNKRIDYSFLLKSIKNTLKGLKYGFLVRFKKNS